jgi:adenosine deaminase
MSVVELARERGVVFEVCLTSNVHTGVISELVYHPVNAWLACGIRAVICPDNTFFSNVSSSQEHLNALSIPAISEDTLRTMVTWGHEAAFRR